MILMIILGRPKKFTLKGYKRNFFVLRDLQLTAYRTQEDSFNHGGGGGGGRTFSVNLKGCEVTPEVNIGSGKYGIKLAVPSADGMSDLWLKCDTVSILKLFARDVRVFAMNFCCCC